MLALFAPRGDPHFTTGSCCCLFSDDEGVYHDDQLEFDTGYGNIILVDNLPVVAKAKFEKLETVLKKIYNQFGVIKENGLCSSKCKGEDTIGYKLDKSHIFSVNMFDDFDRLMNVKEWEAPQTKPYVPGKWLTDVKARDQLVIRSGPDTEVLWNDPRQKNTEPVHKRSYWIESYVQWSPLGMYLVTLHNQGAAVWGWC